MKIFDAHFHIIDYQYPIVENNGYTPPEYPVLQYQKAIDLYQLQGGAIVSGSFQAFDQEYLMKALDTLGDDYVGVANIHKNMSDREQDELNRKNVVAVRFNLKRGGSESVEHMEYLSNKLFEKYNWHTELYVDSKDLMQLKPILSKIKRFSIDHLGLSKTGLKDMYYWVEKGVKVKATGFGRIDFDRIEVMKKINNINPNALIFGTDLPSTRAKTPFSDLHISMVKDQFDDADVERIFYKNARNWYLKNDKG